MFKLTQYKSKIYNRLYQMACTPKQQIKRLAIGTAVSLLSLLLLILLTSLEEVWIFHCLAISGMLGVIYALPGYLGIWMWRMKDVFFNREKNKDDR